MPRLPRVYIQGCVYYITCRSLPGVQIFTQECDYEMYMSLLAKYIKEYGAGIRAYALLPEQMHLLLAMDNKAGVSQFMHNLNSAYTKYYNGQYQRKGHLFRERFRAVVVEDSPVYVVAMCHIIHLAAKKSESSGQAKPVAYNSSAWYRSAGNSALCPPGSVPLESFSEGLKVILSERSYDERLAAWVESEEPAELEKGLRKGIIGSPEFMQRVQEEIYAMRQPAPAPTAPDADQPRNSNSRSKFSSVRQFVLMVILLAAAFAGVLFVRPEKRQVRVEERGAPAVVVETASVTVRDLENTEWRIRLVAPDGAVKNDALTFFQGKFSSAFLTEQGFGPSNFSVTREEALLSWETMQSSGNGTASWRGEVENSQMRGVLSVRRDGNSAQDFTFASIRVVRKEQHRPGRDE
ncbi:MAG: transposase [Candidatus Omnitrophica bacterium]|nr:transposase [Candidatus Omnitrophota bacterium]